MSLRWSVWHGRRVALAVALIAGSGLSAMRPERVSGAPARVLTLSATAHGGTVESSVRRLRGLRIRSATPAAPSPARAPTVRTGTAGDIGLTTATLTGTVDAAAGYRFEWGTGSFTEASPWRDAAAGLGAEHVAAQAPDGGFAWTGTADAGDSGYVDAGLSPGVRYGYRIAAVDAAGNESDPAAVVFAVAGG